MIKDLIKLLIGGYLICAFLGFLEKVCMIIPTPILIVGFCYLIYKTILNELIEGRN